MREILLVRFGEVFLKGQNRPFFMKKLMDHIRQAVRPVDGPRVDERGTLLCIRFHGYG